MAKARGSGSTASIPIESIIQEYAAWSDEIVNAVGNALLKEARTRARSAFSDQDGTLRKSIKKKKSRFGKDAHIVGAFAPHAHLVEFGTKMRIGKGGKVSGHMPALPFLGPATDAVRARLTEIVNSVVTPSIEVKK